MGFHHIGSRQLPLDPEIKLLVIELNRKGYTTEGSCAGHGKYGAGLGNSGQGYISFGRSLSPSEARNVITIMRKYGCKRIGFPPSINAGGKVRVTAAFSPMGKIAPKGTRRH